ncbi:hypothetical protein HP499_06400 [Paenarthrobacter sp. CM16]|uniref:DUF5684 domain-containing protein n=1 Tax=Paenarthrobacter sp. CM16 TaxID=2738447 RepID=UPI001552E536|nr:DUF5684 domain-containing protein [Paenarthrobacter sp. CM16]NQD87436.1 hypothetical protein [Paenarthrobacter sp. CM16]
MSSYSSSGSESAAAAGLVMLLMVIYFAVVFAIVGVLYMGIFTKAGRPAWAAFVPIYNSIKVMEIAGRPWYWLLLSFIPFAGIYFSIVALHDLSKSFGKDAGYTVGLVLLPVVFVPMLSYGSAPYLGPAAGRQFVPYPQGYPQGYAPAYPQGYGEQPPAQQPPAQQFPGQPFPGQQPPSQNPNGQQYR